MRRTSHRAVARAAVFAAVALAVTSGVGCGSSREAAVAGDSAARFPSETLRDWVSYADYVAAYTVVAEREIPPAPADVDRGEGLIGRDVTLRVDKVVWRAAGAPALPETLHMTALGWVLVDGKRRELVEQDAPRVAVGERYVAPLARVEDDPQHPEWWPLGVGAQLPLVDGRVSDSGRWSSALKSGSSGKTLDVLRRDVRAAAPDPLAARYGNLRPTERVRAVTRARSQDSPTTSSTCYLLALVLATAAHGRSDGRNAPSVRPPSTRKRKRVAGPGVEPAGSSFHSSPVSSRS